MLSGGNPSPDSSVRASVSRGGALRRSYSSAARLGEGSLVKALGTRQREAGEQRLRARAASVGSSEPQSDAVSRARQRVRSHARCKAQDTKSSVPAVRLDLFRRRDARIQKFLERQVAFADTTELPSGDQSMLRRIANDADTSEECMDRSARMGLRAPYYDVEDISFLEAETEAWTEELFVPLPPPRPSPVPDPGP